MKKSLFALALLMFLAPLASVANAQVVVKIGDQHHHRHCWYSHHHRHCSYR